MTTMGVRSIALWAGIVLMTACGGPLPEEGGSVEEASTVMSEEAMMADENISMEDEGGEQAIACSLEVQEPCHPSLRTCGVRCCDGSLSRRYNTACGDCLPFAYSACAASGSVPWHVRWTQ